MTGKTNAVAAASFGHTVDFISDGLPYAKYIVTDGQSVAAPSPDPTKSGQHFGGWLDDGTAVTFPYTPTGDVTLAAEFVTTREGMVLTEANKTICTLGGRRNYKTNSGWAIAGYAYLSGYDITISLLVALSPDAADITVQNFGSVGEGESFVYHGITYYCPGNKYCVSGNLTSTNTDVTDLYKCTESTVVGAALKLVKRYLREI